MKNLLLVVCAYCLSGFTYIQPENSISLDDAGLSELCNGHSAMINEVDNGINFLHCDCMCSNKENTYYIKKPSDPNFYSVKASQLLKNIKEVEICSASKSIKRKEGVYYFATKVSTGDKEQSNSCYEMFWIDVSAKGISQTGRNKGFEIVKVVDEDKSKKLTKIINIGERNKTKKHHRGIALKKSYLYKAPSNNFKTELFLSKGDNLELLSKKTDKSGQKWIFINHSISGTEEISMWVKAEAIAKSDTRDTDILPRFLRNTKFLTVKKKKAYLYKKPLAYTRTNAYFNKEDKVVSFAEERDRAGQRWHLVSSKNNKTQYMWIRATVVR